jgi:hypothetical protein
VNLFIITECIDIIIVVFISIIIIVIHSIPQVSMSFPRTYGEKVLMNLTYIGPCIAIYLYSKYNKMQQLLKFIYFDLTLYMFRPVFPSIIWNSRLYTQKQTYVKQMLLPAASGHEMEIHEFHLVPASNQTAVPV